MKKRGASCFVFAAIFNFSQLFTTNRLPSPSPNIQTDALEKEEGEDEGVGQGEEERFDEKVVNALDIDQTNFQQFQQIATS